MPLPLQWIYPSSSTCTSVWAAYGLDGLASQTNVANAGQQEVLQYLLREQQVNQEIRDVVACKHFLSAIIYIGARFYNLVHCPLPCPLCRTATHLFMLLCTMTKWTLYVWMIKDCDLQATAKGFNELLSLSILFLHPWSCLNVSNLHLTLPPQDSCWLPPGTAGCSTHVRGRDQCWANAIPIVRNFIEWWACTSTWCISWCGVGQILLIVKEMKTLWSSLLHIWIKDKRTHGVRRCKIWLYVCCPSRVPCCVHTSILITSIHLYSSVPVFFYHITWLYYTCAMYYYSLLFHYSSYLSVDI